MICTWYIRAFCSWNGKPLFRSSFLHLALKCFSKVVETSFVRHYISFSFPPMNIGCVNHICVFAFFAPAPSPLLSASHWKWLMAFRPHSECTNPWIECRCQIPLAWLPTNKQSNQNRVAIIRFEVWSRSDLKENVPPELALFAAGCNFVPRVNNFPKSLSPSAVESWRCQLFAWWWSVCYTTLHCHH